jgi:hypothetical protein
VELHSFLKKMVTVVTSHPIWKLVRRIIYHLVVAPVAKSFFFSFQFLALRALRSSRLSFIRGSQINSNCQSTQYKNFVIPAWSHFEPVDVLPSESNLKRPSFSFSASQLFKVIVLQHGSEKVATTSGLHPRAASEP